MTRYVIVGTGAAGISAAEAIRLRDKGAEIVLISAEKAGYYSRPGLAYYLSKELNESSLYPFTDEDFKQLNVKWVKGQVARLETGQKLIEFQNGKKLAYDKALIAVGAAARKPKLPGIELEGVVYLDSMETTKETIRRSRGWKSAVVIGGGITALEMVEGLAARGVNVHFFLRSSHYWGRVLDNTESAIVLHRLEEEGVRIHRNTEAQEIIGKKGKVKGVLTKDGRTIKANLVGVAIGVGPRLEIAQASGLETGRGVRVNEYFESSQPDVYAAGDVCETFDRQHNSWVVDSLWGIARDQGYLAGLNMAGDVRAYVRQSPLNVTRLSGLTTTIIGTVGNKSDEDDDLTIVRGESETWQKVPDAIVYQNDFAVNRIRIMVGENVLLGAVVMGDQTLSRPLEDLVREKVDITPIRQALLQPDFNAAGTIIKYWERWKDEAV